MQVVKLAQPGYDVNTAGDENLVYNSNWPLLKIYKQDSFTVADASQTVTITDHDLGFIPMFWFFTNNAINAWQGAVAHITEERSEFFGPGVGNIRVNDKKLSFQEDASNQTGSLKLYYYIFALDLTEPYIAPITKVGGVGGGKPARVFKIAKNGKDITSANLQDFIIHSHARSPLIHSVNPSGKVTKDFTATHNLGYLPMFFGYEKQTDGSYTMLPTGQGGSSSLKSTLNDVTFTDTAGKEVTIVILKDPFIIDYSVKVSV